MITLKHEVERGNLYFLVNSLIGAYNRRTDVIGKGLSAIALALSTPQDNSEEVKALTAKLKASTDELESAIKSQSE